MEKTGYKNEEIGVFFITPCPAKITAIRKPLTLDKPVIDGAVAIKDIYPALVHEMGRLSKEEKELVESMRRKDGFKPDPSKEDKSFFDRLKDLF